MSRISEVKITAGIAAVSLLLALFGFVSPIWGGFPIALRFLTGLVVFGVAPGLLLIGPFLSSRKEKVGAADFAVSVLTCSFSCNLVFNIVLFQLHWSLPRLTQIYIGLQAIGYLVWAAITWRRRAAQVGQPIAVLTRPWMAAAWASVIIAAAALVYMNYQLGSPPTNPEELVWLRKLVDNPAVRFDNLSYRAGDPSTYLFVPFQIFVGGTSVVAQADVILIYSLFFAVTTALSIFVIGRLVYVVFGETGVALVACLWMVVIGFLDPNTVIATAGIVAPYPNRYGFAGGVLLPLILLLFWSVLRDPRAQPWRWALLVYVTVEMTFVHARETLLALGAMATIFAILAVRPRVNRQQVLRIAVMIAVTGLVLMTYKRVNLAIAPDLGSYVDDMSRGSKVALAKLLSDNGPFGLLAAPVPGFADVQVDGGRTVTLTYGTYQRMFVDTWGRSYLGRLYLAAALLLLPLFAIAARSIAELSVAVILAGLGLVTSSALLTLGLSAVVGSPEVLIAYNLIALLSVLVVCGSACFGGAALSRLVRERTPAVVALSVAIVGGSYLLVNRMVQWREDLFSSWSARFALTLIVITLLIVAIRLWRAQPPAFAAARPVPKGATLIASSLILAMLMPAIRRSDYWKGRPGASVSPSQFSGDLFRDYPLLVKSGKLDASAHPPSLVRFLRDDVAPNRTLFTGDALALMQTVPHFAAVLSNKGSVAPNYIVNLDYLQKYSRTETQFALRSFFTDQDGISRFGAMLSDYCVDLVIASPDESDSVRNRWEQEQVLHALMKPVFDQEGFIVFAVGDRNGDCVRH